MDFVFIEIINTDGRSNTISMISTKRLEAEEDFPFTNEDWEFGKVVIALRGPKRVPQEVRPMAFTGELLQIRC